jgi:hypothetical protein
VHFPALARQQLFEGVDQKTPDHSLGDAVCQILILSMKKALLYLRRREKSNMSASAIIEKMAAT